jgi:dipeptidyl aminopeptidase/acylaminoacyl peptidase
MQDRYRDMGTPVTEMLPSGQRVVVSEGDFAFFNGAGASPKGDRPFLDRVNLKTKEKTRLFECADGVYESVVSVLDKAGTRMITRRESTTEPPNFFLVAEGKRTALTSFVDPAPEMRQVKKQLVNYKRADGVPLSFTLYLPPNYKPGTKLPTVMWAYPREYNDADTASQITGSPYRFTQVSGASHLFYLLAGYAILDDAALPVIGDPETANNTYLQQIVAGAKAAIDKATELGVTDPKRVGVGGHSYGGFMTANLLAHSDLFAAGVARSGAYNRTLTPFGFQSERRTIWEAPDTYLTMSPFLNAHKINEPILLIHGQADNNTGTFPIQSERMYTAIRGNGGTVRFVYLPFESHGYAARESVEHTLAEMVEWFDKHVKNKAE